ncbi:hypothetical protein [Bradyrhizobium australiense]|uniref:Uncharacterized protein n=1 Tax=Bradyrhizobium australiense TaxID=2721161 RepID=A0A7Y4GRX2_9BRAD|nr:hypothetical protein [Bradyrhizobium australiense]NOJ40317.1 hypothetical protein [Bradyrhizobium australiense]
MKLVSAFGAADLLELDRQTVRRALRHVEPEGYEKKQPRWRMKTIIEAVDRHLGRHNAAPVHTTLDALFEEFDTGCQGLGHLRDLEERRREARRLMVVLVELDKTMRADARARREDELRASLRCDQHFRLALRNFERPCEWSLDECWAVLAEGAE